MSSVNAVRFYALALGTVVLDQATKAIARAALTEGHAVRVIPGFFDLCLSYNDGGVFGALPNWTPFFIIAALVVVFAIVRLREASARSRSLSFGLGLVMGGAIGNLIDRLFLPDRGVTDFLSFHVTIRGTTHSWPTFNVADIAIVVGAVLVFYYVYVVEKRRQDTESEKRGHETD